MKKVAIIMGSDSDLPIVQKTVDVLKNFEVPFEVHVYSAHRTPDEAGVFAENAIKNGDKIVYFVDGETFFGQKDRTLCTVDLTHPNDIGFYRMAETIYPVMKQILEKGE